MIGLVYLQFCLYYMYLLLKYFIRGRSHNITLSVRGRKGVVLHLITVEGGGGGVLAVIT